MPLMTALSMTLLQDSVSGNSFPLGLILVLVVIVAIVIVALVMASKGNTVKPKRPTILVCGATGVGKSTLINTLVGAELAKTATGEPVTQNTDRVATDASDFVFFDSKGLEVEDASQTYLLLMSDLLRLRFGGDPSDQIDLVLMCIQQVQGRVDDTHLEIAGLCQDLNIPFGIALTKTDGPCELEDFVREKFATARFVRRILAKEIRLPNLTLPAVGVDEIKREIWASARIDDQEGNKRARRGRNAQTLAASARRLAAAGKNSDGAWVNFTGEAWLSLSMQGEKWDRVLKSQRALIKEEIVPSRFKRALNTRFDNGKIDAGLSRRLLPLIMRRFSDETGRLQLIDFAQARKEAIVSFEDDRPYRSRF
jgi:GTP-binding protein EngB required for normal cell division